MAGTIHVNMEPIVSKIWTPAPENEAQLIRDAIDAIEAAKAAVAKKVEAERRARAVGYSRYLGFDAFRPVPLGPVFRRRELTRGCGFEKLEFIGDGG